MYLTGRSELLKRISHSHKAWEIYLKIIRHKMLAHDYDECMFGAAGQNDMMII